MEIYKDQKDQSNGFVCDTTPVYRSKAKKGDLNDLDFDIEDLLADDTPRDKKKTSKYRTAPPKKKPNLEDDAFYKQLAADNGLEEVSDVSEADPAEIAKSLQGLDDMDAGLFGPNKSRVTSAAPSKTPPPKSPRAAAPKSPATPSAASKMADSYLFDDDPKDSKPAVKSFKKKAVIDDDPLADLDFDDFDLDDDAPKVTGRSAGQSGAKAESKMLDIERPPTRSGNHTPDKKDGPTRDRQDDVMFDDDEVLGGMGLSSPTSNKTFNLDDDSRPGAAKAVFDSLLGTGSTNPARPATGQMKEFVLDSRYKKPQKKEPAADDFSFGGYMPSSANTSSRPNTAGRRSVRFEEDGERPKSTPARGSYLEHAVENDSRDWLELASGGKGGAQRPSSDSGSSKGKKDSLQQEAVDWLGLSRLGSPDPSARDRPTRSDQNPSDDEDFSNASLNLGTRPPKKSPRGGPVGGAGAGAGQQSPGPRTTSPPRTPPKTTPVKASHNALQEADDWLGRRSSPSPTRRNDNWFGRSRSPPRHNKMTLQKQSSLEHADPELGTGGGTGEGADNFLGLGKEVDIDSIVASKPRSSSPFRKAEDLFTAPLTRNELRSSLPWESGRGSSPPRSAPARTSASGPQRRPSLAESPRGLNDSLDALLHAEKKQIESRSGPTATGSAAPPPPIAAPNQSTAAFEQQLAEQQKAAQAQWVEQQKKLQQQQQQQVEAMQRYQQQMLEQQKQMMMQPGMPMSFGGFGMFGQDAESKIKKLEMEKAHVEMILETTKTQHAEQIKLLEESYQKRISLIEDSFKGREERLREENELLSRDTVEKMRSLEKARSEMTSAHFRQHGALEEAKRQEVEAVRVQFRQIIDDLHREHEEDIHRLKRIKDQEMEAVVNRHSHSQVMSNVMNRVGENVRELETLHNQVASSHLYSLSEREKSAIDRDNQLKALQERLEQQSHDQAQERAKLHSLVTKLELQLTEQSRDVEAERWRLRQEEQRMRTAQEALEAEKTAMMAAMAKERTQLEKAKDKLLEEQKSVLAQIYEERSALADERAQLTVSQKLAQDENTRTHAKNTRAEIEVDATVKAISAEKERLHELRAAAARDQAAAEEERERLHELRAAAARDQAAAEEERVRVRNERELLRAEQEKLERIALAVKEKSKQAQEVYNSASGVREEGQRELSQARRLEVEQAQRLAKIQAELANLRAKEKQIAQERLALAKEKQMVERARESLLCTNCSTPVRDVPHDSQEMQRAESAQHLATTDTQMEVPRLTTHAQKLFASLPADMRSDVNSRVKVDLEMDRSIRQFKMTAQKDKAYLDEENKFLQVLKHTPYNK